MSLVFEDIGVPVTYQKISPADTATGLDADTINPSGTHKIKFTSGGTGTIQVNDKITGASSSATAIVTGVVIDSGTFAGGDAEGTLYVKTLTGTFTAENVNTPAQNNIATVSADVDAIIGDLQIKAILVVVESNDVNAAWDGFSPTAAAGTNHGFQISAGQNTVIKGKNAIKNFKVIDRVSGSTATVKVVGYF